MREAQQITAGAKRKPPLHPPGQDGYGGGGGGRHKSAKNGQMNFAAGVLSGFYLIAESARVQKRTNNLPLPASSENLTEFCTSGMLQFVGNRCYRIVRVSDEGTAMQNGTIFDLKQTVSSSNRKLRICRL